MCIRDRDPCAPHELAVRRVVRVEGPTLGGPHAEVLDQPLQVVDHGARLQPVSYTHLRAHETSAHL
eukprot:10187465-Alexandrium_andersonii.AAC.1